MGRKIIPGAKRVWTIVMPLERSRSMEAIQNKSIEILPIEDEAIVIIERENGTVNTFYLTAEEWNGLQRACKQR